MRYKISFALVSIALLLLVLDISSTKGQEKGGFPGNFPGGFPGGGKGKGGFGGGGQGGFQGKGRKGSGGGFPGGFPGPGGFQGFQKQGPGGFQSMGGPQGNRPFDVNQMAEADFNLRDRNGDGFLNMDEMPEMLKADLSKWDSNRDNLINLDEYKVYFATVMQNRGSDYQPGNSNAIIIEEEDIETRPVVFRAGKLPKELPNWFKQLDTDKDGQVALFEWRRAGKDLDEFAEWDRNNDGFITPEEALYKLRLIQIAKGSSSTDGGDSPNSAMMKSDAGRSMKSGGMKGRNKGG